MKRLLVVSVVLCFFVGNKASAQTWDIGYPNPTDVTATLNDSVLSITGTGEMKDHGIVSDPSPWRSSCDFIKNVVIDSGITKIGTGAFAYCANLISIVIPNSVRTVGNVAFYDCTSLTFLTIPDSVTTIGDYAFYHCTDLASINIPNFVTTIGDRVFAFCSSLTSVTIPNSVTTIGFLAFQNCYNLTSLTLGNSVMIIGSQSFTNCHSLTSIYLKTLTPPHLVGANVFFNVSKSISVHVPCARVAVYQGWGDFTNIIDDINEVAELTVQSADLTMGTVAIIQTNSCANNYQAIISATANIGYRFIGWNDGGMDSVRTITVSQDMTFTAEFEAIPPCMVTVLVNDSIMGSVSGGGTYYKDSIAALRATANAGFRFVQWHDDDTINPRTITVIQDTAFTAEFEQYIFSLTLAVNDTTMGTVSGSGDYKKDSLAIITATANSGYHFVRWHDGDTTNPRTITVTSDTLLTAEFEVDNSIWHSQISSAAIYPNPASDNIRISLSEHPSNVVFVLYDMQGKEMLKQSISNKDVISVDGLSAGVYVYNVFIDGKYQQGKLLIIK